jgi:hypothetical protein
MAKQKREQTFEQKRDERGRIRLDRRLTPQEAAEQDQEHRERYLAQRLRRFAPQGEAAHESAA